MADTIADVKSIFGKALELSTPEERAAYLDQACGGDPRLRAEVESLLHAQAGAAGFFKDVIPAPGRTLDERLTEGPGTVIGPYKLLEQIGEGGMGTVWRAQQTQPVKRVVALKLIKAGMDSKQVIARFEAERQALALMDHANIARVLDAGTTSAGRPYFVMDLVKGVPIIKYCDEHHLTPRQRLELFIPVCQAVQHAHQKGIIHRDLKSSNVLVALCDGKPVPKVIDFGVAKAAGQPLTDKTLVTGFGAIVGTLEYMSPEQAEINQPDIDTRSDIYSLGVLLYELLAGSPPFTREELEKGGGMLEMLRVIREQEPSRPSTKLSTANSLPTLAANRGTEPAKLTKLVRGELDWIVMKALEKDRNRRYETANGFASDVQRYLTDEPVQACPPSVGYRCRKFVRRNKGPVVAACLVLAALVSGIIGTTWQAVQAERARLAEAERAESETAAKRQATAERNRAEVEKQIAQAVTDFLQKGLLRMADPFQQAEVLRLGGGAFVPADNPRIKELLDRAAAELTPEKIEGKFPGQPLVQAEILRVIGESYRGTGEYMQAIAHLKRSSDLYVVHRGPDHMRTLVALTSLASAYREAGPPAEAIKLFEQVRDQQVKKLGPDHLSTLATLDNLAQAYLAAGQLAEAIKLFEQVRDQEVEKLGPDALSTLITLHNLAQAYLAAGRLAEAIELLQHVRDKACKKLRADHPYALAMLHNLAQAYGEAGRLAEAIELLQHVRDWEVGKLGPNHPSALTTLHNLALAFLAAGRLPEAIKLFEQVRDQQVKKLGPDHPSTVDTLHNLAMAYKELGRLPEAIKLFQQVRDQEVEKLGPDHPHTLTTLHNLALAYLDAERLPEAIKLFEQVRDQRVKKLGPDHPHTLITVQGLAGAFRAAGRLPEAVKLFEQVRDQQVKKLGPDHPDTLMTLLNLARAFRAVRRLPEAVKLLEQVRDQQVKKFGPDHPHTLITVNSLAAAHWSGRQLDRSVPLFEETLRRQIKVLGQDHPDTMQTAFNLSVNYRDAGRLEDALQLLDDWLARAAKVLELGHRTRTFGRNAGIATYGNAGRYDRQEPLLREAAELAKRHAGAEAPRYAVALNVLGHNLLRQKKWADAEPLLRNCLAIRTKQEPDSWRTFNTQSLLGEALLGQKQYAAAEPLLLAGYQGMKQREAKMANNAQQGLTEAAGRLVRLYDVLGKEPEASRWRQELAVWKGATPAQKPKEK